MSGRRHLLFVVLFAALVRHAVGMEIVMRPTLQNASFWDSTYLVDVQQGSHQSQVVSGLRNGGFELAAGEAIGFNDWYRSNWTDTSLIWMTQVTKNLGILFGASTGEKGKKYTIDPSLRLGLVAHMQPARNMFLSFRATTNLGGRLREKSCTADYGEIGGVQEVNCRLAASTLPPEETLQYLLNAKPYNRNHISVTLSWQFE